MKISVQRSGGFAGVTEMLVELDTEQMSVEAARRVEQLVQDIDFFSLPDHVPGAVGADQFHHEISIVDEDHQHRVVFEDDGRPETASLHQFKESLLASL